MEKKPTNETRICHHCQRVVGKREPCTHCVEAIPNRPDPANMTADEKVAELHDLCGVLETSMEIVKDRICRLIGRSIWSHELGSHGIEQLIKEIRGEASQNPMESFAEIFGGRGIVVETE